MNSKKFDDVGFSVTDITSSIKKQYDVEYGVLVNNVVNYSEAFNRGLRAGCVITEADKSKIDSSDKLASIINDRKKGDIVVLKIITPNKDIRLIALEIQ
jgi:S1-C subfamily serine protease